MAPATLERIMTGEVAKGDVLTAARLAGVMAAKQTPQLIPLCHPLLIDTVEMDCLPHPERGIVEVTAAVSGSGRTGFEMEALTAAAVAALTIYDMCKAYDPGMRIELALLSKSGGKSGRVRLGPMMVRSSDSNG
jgi:cyclic pyranopterin phosphate synthase